MATTTRCLSAVALVSTLLVLAVASAEGQDVPKARTFGGHLFQVPGFIDGPFTGTYLRTTTGAGRALGLELPLYNLEGVPIDTLSGNIAFFVLGLDYQQRLTRWLALRVGFSGAARLGTDYLSLLAEGFSAIYGGNVGATLRLAETRRFFLSAGVDARSNKLYSISPLDFAKSIIDSGLTDSSTALLSKGNNWRFVGGLRAAYAFAPWIGVLGVAEVGPATRVFADTTGERKATQFNIGGSLGIDFRPGTGVPVGIVGSFLHQSINDRATDVGGKQQTTGLGVFYTGRQDLSLGLEMTFQRLKQRDAQNSIDVSQARLLLRYDF